MATFLRNCWYAVAYSSELTKDKMLARRLLDEPLVMYRKQDDSIAILSDSCPHRFAPMSEGVLIGDEIRCGYHGLLFNSDGECTDNPHDPKGVAPKSACLKSYPSFERYGIVWYWPGDADKLDESLLPDFSFLGADNRRTQYGYLHADGNYQLVSDNLLDLTHAPYIHPQFVVPNSDIQKQLDATETKLIIEGDSITAFRLRKGLAPNLGTIALFDFTAEDVVDTRSHITWYPPSLIKLDSGTYLVDTDPEGGFTMLQTHLITPETSSSCHYFFAVSRNMKLDDEMVDEKLMELLDTAFRTQDEPMIKKVQERMNTDDLMSLNPVLLVTDAAPMAARRQLSKMIAAENK